jgi:hypothetical protein
VNGAQITKPARASDGRADPWVRRAFWGRWTRQSLRRGRLPNATTTTTTRSVPTSTTLITLKGVGPQLNNKRAILVFVAVPNVVGMTLAQANSALSAVGLSWEVSTPSTAAAGTSSTGTILAQGPVAGSQAPRGEVIQLTVSGY